MSVDLRGNICDNPSSRIFWRNDNFQDKMTYINLQKPHAVLRLANVISPLYSIRGVTSCIHMLDMTHTPAHSEMAMTVNEGRKATCDTSRVLTAIISRGGSVSSDTHSSTLSLSRTHTHTHTHSHIHTLPHTHTHIDMNGQVCMRQLVAGCK